MDRDLGEKVNGFLDGTSTPPQEISRVAAVIVLYHPKEELLNRLLQSLAGQVHRVIVIDNSPDTSPRYSSIFPSDNSFSYQPLGKNTGIATAQNIGIRQALAENYSHVLLLDQDSALPGRMVEDLLEAERQLRASGEKVAAVGPVFLDEKTGELSPAIRHRFLRVRKIRITPSQKEPIEADYLISSGSLIRTAILQVVGMMREELFIDWVDIEWGLRARGRGLKSFMVPTVTMNHSIGDETVNVLGRKINLHNDVRNYYIVRNATYLLRQPTMGRNWRLVTFFKIPQYVLFYSWHSAHRLRSLGLLLRAIGDGSRGLAGRIS